MAEYALFFRDEAAVFDGYNEADIKGVVDDFVIWTRALAAQGKFAGARSALAKSAVRTRYKPVPEKGPK